MKYTFSFYLFFLPFLLFSQNEAFEDNINDLKSEITKATGAEKLILTDSLITLIEFNEDYNYSSFIKENITLALKLDSIDLATKHTADFIFYHNAILGRIEDGLQLFKDYKGKESKGNNYAYMVNLYLYGSDSYGYLGDFKSALQELKIAEEYARQLGDKRGMGNVISRMGFINAQMGQFAEASKNLQDASKIFKEVKDTLQFISTHNALAILYSQNNFFDEAMETRNYAIELSKTTQGNPYLNTLYYNKAADYREKKDYKNWIKYLKLAKIANENQDNRNSLLPLFLSDLVIAAAITDSISLAENYFDEFKSSVPLYDDKYNRRFFLEASKQLAFAKKHYQDALRYGREHLLLKKQENSFVELYNAEKFMADVYKAMGNQNKANEHLVSYYEIKDSISNVKNVQNLSYYQTLFETEQRDNKIKEQENNILLLDEKDKVKNQWILFGSSIALGLFGFILLLRSRNAAQRRRKLQENFTKDILKTQENERARIAGELHDSIGQKLLLIKNALVAEKSTKEKEIDLVGETIKEVREMSHNLHPFQFEKLGLVTSLKNMMQTFQKNSDVFYSEDINIKDNLIAKEKEIYIFRMLQECITNVEKHAEAVACNLSASENSKEVIFQLKDNGKGFIVPENRLKQSGLGMKTLQERAQFIGAILNIDSQPGKGTTIQIKVPKL